MKNSGFDHSFSWKILTEIPEGRKYLNFQSETNWDSIEFLVEVFPKGRAPWIGNFTGSGFDFPSGVFTTPNKDLLCINSSGSVYFINPEFPQDYFQCTIEPVVDIINSVENNLMIFIGFTQLMIFDKLGIKFTKKVSKDGIKITQISKEKIWGLAYSPIKNQYVNFEIDLENNKLSGGSV